MNNTTKPVDTDTLDYIAIKLISTLDRTDLVHLLLDVSEPTAMLQNIILANKGQTIPPGAGDIEETIGCTECTEIHTKLLGILYHHNLEEDDVLHA